MAGKPRSAIIRDIEEHVAKNGGVFTEWYVGISGDPRRSLFTRHRLRSAGDAWISRRAIDDLQAAEIEEYFRSVRRTRAGDGRKGLDDVFVYAYRMKPHTSP